MLNKSSIVWYYMNQGSNIHIKDKNEIQHYHIKNNNANIKSVLNL